MGTPDDTIIRLDQGPLSTGSPADDVYLVGSSTILVVDDSKTALNETRRTLESCPENYIVLTAADGLEAYKMLATRPVDLILCDLVMKGIDGHKFLALKANRKELLDIPVIMLTSAECVEDKVRTLEAGAADYLTKPFHGAELIARVRIHLRLRGLQQLLRDKNEKLSLLASTDELTGLANRREFMRSGELELSRARRYGHPLSCVLLDLDHFKRVNDTYGHLAGDAVLRTVGQTILGARRDHDIVARYGGEEIVLLLPHTGLEGAITVAERHRASIGLLEVTFQGTKIPVTASLGATTMEDKGQDLKDLLDEADQALYVAKERGRNRVCTFKDIAGPSRSSHPELAIPPKLGFA